MPYALFDGDERVGEPVLTKLEVWQQVLEAGLISELPVADEEEGGKVLPPGFHIREIDGFDPRRSPTISS
jgi:hypothetical protein